METMKLSEAIRRGCELAPTHATGRWGSAEEEAACAIGAAVIAVGHRWPSSLLAKEEWPFLARPVFATCHHDACTAYLGEPWPLANVMEAITHLSDRHLTREEIADFLERAGR